MLFPKPISAVALLVGLCSHGPLWASGAPIEPDLMAIPAGEFVMGHPDKKSTSPAHVVTLKGFQMGKYEVTVKEFAQFVAATGYKAPQVCGQMAGKEWFDVIPGSWDRKALTSNEFEPVVCVGVAGAEAYVRWLAQVTGKPYRLPTEAEWEYAARAGSTTRFFYGDDANPEQSQACRYGNVADRRAEAAIKRDFDGLESKGHVGVVPCDDGADYASVVGMYEPNAWGLHDTLGNVQEFVQDCFFENYEGAPSDGSARVDDALACKKRTLRGGTWHWPAFHSARRGGFPVEMIGSLEGFRLVLDSAAPVTKASPSSLAFQSELARAQAKERERRARLSPV
ncbi:formylglycine-generating enzyme required for sulfatase activity [Inhella inkyongensis]|uniref:Formylglycine-generating enzyme required for sulfatase activity n=1 Tax=Inhella inkyongensis TaxID=392593 RepID=A0A840S5T9_9BURK|nr:SUMF1/EgtB/PvdO family nonheme iron enzyme [Inhella inkyongensis]MBB5204376.1 formylglycine-generating enzyme required for sulfatase activity [Inhella inkyongensis]